MQSMIHIYPLYCLEYTMETLTHSDHTRTEIDNLVYPTLSKIAELFQKEFHTLKK